MVNDQPLDKRQRARYLCDEYFSSCIFISNNEEFEVTAIDFSKEGMGFFSTDHIPESGSVTVCFIYRSPTLALEFNALPCTIVYSNQTEVGTQFGVRFEIDQLPLQDKFALEEIESSIALLDDPEDRYHLFGGE